MYFGPEVWRFGNKLIFQCAAAIKNQEGAQAHQAASARGTGAADPGRHTPSRGRAEHGRVGG